MITSVILLEFLLLHNFRFRINYFPFLTAKNSAFGISGGRSRMPDAHVEMLLDCYKLVQEERTLDSGRLGKGAFHQVILVPDIKEIFALDGPTSDILRQIFLKLKAI